MRSSSAPPTGSDGVTVAVRIGYDDNRELGEKETGGRAALPIFRDVVRGIYTPGPGGDGSACSRRRWSSGSPTTSAWAAADPSEVWDGRRDRGRRRARGPARAAAARVALMPVATRGLAPCSIRHATTRRAQARPQSRRRSLADPPVHNRRVPLSPSSAARLATQLDCLPALLEGHAPEALERRTRSGKWSVHENLAHLARHHAVVLDRVRSDPRRGPARRCRATRRKRTRSGRPGPRSPRSEVLTRLRALRTELTALVGRTARRGSSRAPRSIRRWAR